MGVPSLGGGGGGGGEGVELNETFLKRFVCVSCDDVKSDPLSFFL